MHRSGPEMWIKHGTSAHKLKYIHLVELGPVKGVRLDFPEAISIQHPAAIIKKSCHFSQNTSEDENISHVFISAPLTRFTCSGGGCTFSPFNSFFKILI